MVLALAVLAVVVGVLIGMVGVGGVLLPPGLVALGDLTANEATATSTWAFLFTGVVGTVAYACDCSVVDVFSDPGRTLPLIEERIRGAGPVMRFLLEANFSRLDRSQRPRPAEYRLAWSRDGYPPGLPNWYMNSPWTGQAFMYLEPIEQRGGGGGI